MHVPRGRLLDKRIGSGYQLPGSLSTDVKQVFVHGFLILGDDGLPLRIEAHGLSAGRHPATDVADDHRQDSAGQIAVAVGQLGFVSTVESVPVEVPVRVPWNLS